MKNNQRMSLYIDDETREHLEILAKKYHRSKNNLVTFLVNKEFENTIDIDTIHNRLVKIKSEDMKLDRASLNEMIYDE